MDRIYKITSPVWTEEDPVPPQSVLIATQDDDEAYLVGEAGFEEWDALASTLVGSWDPYNGLQEGQSYDDSEPPVVIGTPTHPVTADYLGWIRPLGNANRRATGPLDSTRWAGHAEPKFLQDADRYPNTNNPFYIRVVRDDNTVGPEWSPTVTYAESDKVTWGGKGWNSLIAGNLDNEPGTNPPRWEEIESGWGWTATMIKASTSRPSIVNYFMQVYPTVECTPGTQLFSTGAFQDVGGDVYESVVPPGQWTPAPDAVYFALVYNVGNVQEGIFSMEAGQDSVEAQFWSQDQA